MQAENRYYEAHAELQDAVYRAYKLHSVVDYYTVIVYVLIERT